MKILALLLITLNITFILWQYHLGRLLPEQKTEIAGADSENLIVLLNELKDVSTRKQSPIKDQCRVEDSIDKSIERALFVSDISASPASNDALDGLLLSEASLEWLGVNLISEITAEGDSKEASVIGKLEPLLAQATVQMPEMKQSNQSSKPVAPPDRERAVEPVDIIRSREAEKVAIDVGTPKTAIEPLPKKAVISSKKPSYDDSMCYEAGPFDNIWQFNAWRKQTGIDPRSIKQVTRKGQKITDYLVYYPAGETYAQSLENLEMLKQKGITDYWLFSKGESKGDISLGVFSSENRAQIYKQQLAEKALEVSVKPRFKDIKIIYAQIYIDQEFEDKLIASRDKWKKTHPEFAITVSSGCVFN